MEDKIDQEMKSLERLKDLETRLDGRQLFAAVEEREELDKFDSEDSS